MRFRILIADNSELLRDRLKKMIISLNPEFLIQEAGDGLETLLKINAFNPDLLILDIQMPQKTGIQVLRELAGHDRPLVFIFTNHGASQYRKRCRDLGVKHFFLKATESEKMISELFRLSTN